MSKGEGAAGQGRARQGGVPLPPGVGFPPFLVQLGDLPCSKSRREGKGREKGRKEGAQPLPLVQFELGLGGRPTSSLFFP